MSEPYIGTIIQAGFNFAPRGWAMCNGQLMSISQYTALFALIGTTYGGDGQTTFALPDLRGRRPIGQGTGPGLANYAMGQQGGTEATTLTASNLPAHSHPATFNNTSAINATTQNATANSPAGSAILAKGVDVDVSPDAIPMLYAPAGSTPVVDLLTIDGSGAVQVGIAGNGIPVGHLPPYNTMNFIIALEGIFPSRN